MILAVGLCTVDLVQRVEVLPVPGQKVQSTAAELVTGGPAANAAIAIAVLGGRVRLVTVLGTHPLADLARRDLERYGVEVHDVMPDRAEPPTVSAVSVRQADGERTVVSHNASGIAAAAHLPLSNVDAVLLDGHHPALALQASRAAAPIILDAGSRKPVFTELLPHVDICACSSAFQDEVDCPVVTRTHGPDPVQWIVGDQRGEVAVPRVQAKDTAGAGDVWHGALTLAVARLGHVPSAAELPDLIGYANHVASLRVQHEGASWRDGLQ